MLIFICSTTGHGCGFIGHSDEFIEDLEGEYIFCPECGKDTPIELTAENLDSILTGQQREFARLLIENDESIVAIAPCGCVHHAERGIACRHDVALARERFYEYE